MEGARQQVSAHDEYLGLTAGGVEEGLAAEVEAAEVSAHDEYLGLTAGGMEEGLAAEVEAAGGAVRGARRGAVRFALPAARARALRRADRVLAALGPASRPFPLARLGWEGRAALPALEGVGERMAGGAAAALDAVRRWRAAERSEAVPETPSFRAAERSEAVVPETPSFRASCKRTCTSRAGSDRGGKQSFTSEQAAGAFGAGLAEAAGWGVSLRQWHVEVWLYIEDDELVCAGVELLRRQSAAGRALSLDLHALRPWRAALVKTALKASVARALLDAAELEPGEVVVDVTCGCGTVPIEAAATAARVVSLGGDLDEGAIAAAAANASAAARCGGMASAAPGVLQWDVTTRLPLREGSVDCIVSDLPFGKRCGKPGHRNRLYTRLGREAARVLRVGGRAAFLCCARNAAGMFVQGGKGRLELVSTREITYELIVQLVVLRRVEGGAALG